MNESVAEQGLMPPGTKYIYGRPYWCSRNTFASEIAGSVKERVAQVAAAGSLSRSLNGPLPYVRRHITVTKCVECVVK